MMGYGKELIIDVHEADPTRFNRSSIRSFCESLCERIGMTPEDLHFWDDFEIDESERQTNPKTKGTTAVQFILTSNITIHTLDELCAVYVNVFSCADFDSDDAVDEILGAFGGTVVKRTDVMRL